MDKDKYINSIKRVIISKEEIQTKIAEAGRYIDNIYDGRPILLVGILNGCFVFMADIARAVTVPCEIAFMSAKSYVGTESAGEVQIILDIDRDLSQYHVVIAEDIIDTGRTLKKITEILKSRNPLSLTVVTLLDKPDRRVVDFKADYALFKIPDLFVIGYGLDYNGYYRNLPYIAEFQEK